MINSKALNINTDDFESALKRMETPWGKFKSFLHSIEYRFLRRIRNVLRWLPYIWKNDGDWSHTYIFDVMKIKITQIRDYISKNKRYVGWEHDVKWMNVTLSLIDKVNTEHYRDEFHDFFESDYEFVEIEDTDKGKKLYEMVEENKSEDFQTYFDNNETLYHQFRPLKLAGLSFDEQKSIAYKIADAKHKKAKTLLFKILNEKIEGWWD